jgi:CHAD domain-containing protein
MEATDPGSAAQTKLIKLTRKRLENFVTLLAKFLVNDDPGTIHDLRVRSRRLQQVVQLIVRAKTPGRRKLSRALRRVRKALGPCRNIDVSLELVKGRLEQAGSPALKDGWEMLAAHLRREREPLLAEARGKIARYDLMPFVERAQKLISDADRQVDPSTKLSAAARRCLAEWDKTYEVTANTGRIEQVHALRIATKRLRYRAEILSDSGTSSAEPVVKDLKEIQSALGDWHDQCVLLEFVAAFVDRPKALAKHAGVRDALRAQMKQEQNHNAQAVEKILRRAGALRKRWEKCFADERPSG